jgi:hypothetical protein
VSLASSASISLDFRKKFVRQLPHKTGSL